MRVAIVDFGLGNLRSVAAAIEKVGHTPVVSGDPEVLGNADKLVLPGVGAFGDAMRRLEKRGLVVPLKTLVETHGMPILGICLGAQLICGESDEFGRHKGLGFIAAKVVRLAPDDPALRVPHVGWNDLFIVRDSVLFDGIGNGALFYYVHSHKVVGSEPDTIVGECEYGGRFTAAVQKGSICAAQFHPEKSQLEGLRFLSNFIEKI